MENWGYEIRILREEERLSQQEVADIVGVSRRYIGRIEKGDYKNPQLQWFEGFSRAFNISVDTLKQIAYGMSSKDKAELERVPVFKEYPFTGGTMPAKYIYRFRGNKYNNIEAYIMSINLMAPSIAEGDIALVDRLASINEGDTLMYRLNGDSGIGILKTIREKIFIENNKGLIDFLKVKFPSLVIGVEKWLK